MDARRLEHVHRAHDVELDRGEGIALRARGEHRVGGGVDDLGDVVLADRLRQRERAQHVALDEAHAVEREDFGQGLALRRVVHENGRRALLDQEPRNLRANESRADHQGRHRRLLCRAMILPSPRGERHDLPCYDFQY